MYIHAIERNASCCRVRYVVKMFLFLMKRKSEGGGGGGDENRIGKGPVAHKIGINFRDFARNSAKIYPCENLSVRKFNFL